MNRMTRRSEAVLVRVTIVGQGEYEVSALDGQIALSIAAVLATLNIPLIQADLVDVTVLLDNSVNPVFQILELDLR